MSVCDSSSWRRCRWLSRRWPGALVAAWSRLWERRAAGLLSALAALWPGLVWAVLFLLLLDNFTYTLFRFGVRSGYRYWRLGYALVFAGLWL